MTNANLLSKDRCVDIVFCIDGTGSMHPCIESVKKNALRFHADFTRALTGIGSAVSMLRVRTVVFRDYKSEGADAILPGRFYELPDEEKDFAGHLGHIHASGGCGEDANGLEALYYAMRSDFSTGANDRQVIVLFADTDAIPLGKRRRIASYPKDMVTPDGLLETWMCLQTRSTRLRERNKRLVMFAPPGTVYERMGQTFNRSVFVPVEIHKGLDGVDFDDIVKIIAASASAAS